MRQVDTRLIQTAVIGGRDSDQPVILPEQPHNFDQFLRQFGRDDFWCGILLGGCGQPLRPKRYVTRVCHFAHEASPGRDECHRTTHSADSADHLFIKAHATRWLAAQGHTVRGELRTLGHCHGDAVDFRLPQTDMFLRFELHSEDYRTWREAADSLGAKEGRIEWVFGQSDQLAHDMLARRGYTLLVRCETEGNDRRVYIGTLTDGRKAAWEPLDKCRMTDKGLVTPTLETLRAGGVVRDDGLDAEPLPAGLPLSGRHVVFAVDTEAEPPVMSPLLTPGRYLLPGFVKPTDSRIVRAYLSLPDSVPAPTEQYVYRLAGMARLLVTDVAGEHGSPWALWADALVKLNGLEAERTGLWRPSVALDEKLGPAPRPPSACEHLLLPKPAPSEPEVTETTPARPTDMLRSALEEVAARGATITWSELAGSLGRWIHDLPDPARQDLLVALDKPRVPSGPLLSVLIVTHVGRPLPYLGRILSRLGVIEPTSESVLQQWAATEAKRTHQAYGAAPFHKAVASRRGTSQSVPAARAPSASDLRLAHRRRAEMVQKVEEAAKTRARTRGARVQRLSEVMDQAEAHLQRYKMAYLRARTLRTWLVESDRILDLLDRLIGRPITAAPAATKHRTESPPVEPVKATESRPAERKDPNLRQIRRLLGELDRTNQSRPTQELFRLLDEIGEHRARLAQPLPIAEARHVECWRGKLEKRKAAEQSAREKATWRSATKKAERNPKPQQSDRLPTEKIVQLAIMVRSVLEERARADGAPMTWGELRARLGGQLPFLHPADRVALLVAADRDTPPDEPLLSTLVDSAVAPHRLYEQVCDGLGRKVAPDTDIETHRAMEALRLRQLWRYRR
ncbi:hypothetical protein ACPCK8_32980 [Streptomyces cellulosae]